jgi:two-component system invasion response regulator UvrY
MQRILLADHHASARWALVTMLQEDPGFELAGEAVDAELLLDLCKENHPDLVLLDKDLPGIPVEDLIATLHQFDPKLVVIVMSTDPADGRRLLRAGADAFASKADQADWLLHVLQKYKSSIPKINKIQTKKGVNTP